MNHPNPCGLGRTNKSFVVIEEMKQSFFFLAFSSSSSWVLKKLKASDSPSRTFNLSMSDSISFCLNKIVKQINLRINGTCCASSWVHVSQCYQQQFVLSNLVDFLVISRAKIINIAFKRCINYLIFNDRLIGVRSSDLSSI